MFHIGKSFLTITIAIVDARWWWWWWKWLTRLECGLSTKNDLKRNECATRHNAIMHSDLWVFVCVCVCDRVFVFLDEEQRKLMKNKEINGQSTAQNWVNDYEFKWNLANGNKNANKNPFAHMTFMLFPAVTLLIFNSSIVLSGHSFRFVQSFICPLSLLSPPPSLALSTIIFSVQCNNNIYIYDFKLQSTQ